MLIQEIEPQEGPEGKPSRWQDIAPHTWERAQYLRRRMTLAERTLWQFLRNRQLGVKFRRQHPIGPYIADFYCPERRLVIELDGNSHAEHEQRLHDADRSLYFETHSVRVIRYTNLQVAQKLDYVLEDISKHLGKSPEDSPPLVPPQAGGDPRA